MYIDEDKNVNKELQLPLFIENRWTETGFVLLLPV